MPIKKHSLTLGIDSSKEKAQGTNSTEGIENQGKQADCASQDSGSKAFSTLVADLTAKGHVVRQTPSGGFTVSKYGYSYFADDTTSLQDFARKLGVSE